MKKIITFCGFLVALPVIFVVSGTFSSCDKQNTNCVAVITVNNLYTQSPVAGATVKLYAPHAQVQAIGTTNAAGTVSFTFTLPAIFNISAAKDSIPGDTLKGSGIIQLQIGSTVSATVSVSQ